MKIFKRRDLNQTLSIDSLKKKYLYKLGSNFISFITSIVIQAIVPRALGPAQYGNFNYLTNFFQQIIGFFDLWSTPSHYIKLSKRPKEFGLISFTFYYVLFVFIVIISSVLLLYFNKPFYTKLLPNQEYFYVLLAALYVFFVWILQILNNISDAIGCTVKSEIKRMKYKIIGVLIIIGLYVYNSINLETYFYYNYLISTFLSFTIILVIKQSNFYAEFNWKIQKKQIKCYIKEFNSFSNPLILSGSIAIVSVLIDRWILQFFSGSKEQGYYGLSYQIGSVCFLFTSAMNSLLTRELSIAFSENNITKMSTLFRKYIPLLYSISAYFASFLAIQSENVVYILGGKQYDAAFLAVTIMCFYPIHQTYGQLSGSVFISSGRTKQYGKISLLITLIGLPLSFFLIASNKYYGLDLGATGLAIKMVLMQIISVTIQLYYNSRFLNFKMGKYLYHQILSLSVLILLSLGSKFIINQFSFFDGNKLLNFLLSGFVYTFCVLLLINFQPRIFAMNKQDIADIKRISVKSMFK